MTRKPMIDKDRLAAFADGELSPEEAAAVVMHLADHPEDQAWVDEVMAANMALARAFAAPMAEPVPDRFQALILPDADPAAHVVAFRPRWSMPRIWAGAALALAAALAVMAVLPEPDAGLRVGPVAAGSALETALMAQASGAVQPLGEAGQLTILATLPATGGYCREFELVAPETGDIQLGLACRAGTGWAVDVLLAETAATGGETASGYLPASGNDAGAIDPWLDRRGAGMALSADEEAALIQHGWSS
ncbi:Putative zinc-finger [Gemmobacter aquatilis]|uniref:Putative zinc-finger n=1 Tax=Gemmobacter aquatilis TaxID=933059 RepID=A0A1H8KLQ2_9RHOB|nr:zf-HC2 domain-containing protein [Gemmobacter aquatilis]SEN93910.1 Putative zinc-finger [Gemmobacter aquatilis]